MNSSAAAAAAVAVAATGAVVAATAAELRFNWDVRGAASASVAAALPQLDYMEDGYDLSFMSEANVICRNCIKLCMVCILGYLNNCRVFSL